MVTPIIRLLGSEASVNSSGSNIGLNKLVRVYNQNDTDVVITGTGMSGTTSVVWNGYNLSFTATSTTVTVRIPSTATGSGSA